MFLNSSIFSWCCSTLFIHISGSFYQTHIFSHCYFLVPEENYKLLLSNNKELLIEKNCHYEAHLFGFSAKFLAENPKPLMFSLCFETALPIFSKSCLNIAYILDKYTQISYFVSKYAILSQIHYIFMINALLSQNLVVEIYALFPPIFLGWQIVPAIFFAFWMYGAMFFFQQRSNSNGLSCRHSPSSTDGCGSS